MSASQTATVETLTAQVRVLMVGSKQVTASVAKQLDFEADPALVTVFGRVRIPGQRQQAIGATAAGELVLTGPCQSGGACGEDLLRDSEDEPYTLACPQGCGRSWSIPSTRGHRLDRSFRAPIRFYCSHAQGDCECVQERPCPYRQQWLDALPLIVLAGLR